MRWIDPVIHIGGHEREVNLRHPHIVPVYEYGQVGDQFYIASAFIQGAVRAAANGSIAAICGRRSERVSSLIHVVPRSE